jgi:hypothetical protein
MTDFLAMGPDQLGIDTIIQSDASGKYILLNQHAGGLEERVCLESEPIFTRPSIIAEGAIACYRARRSDSRRWEFVVKFVWRLETERPEERLLAMTKERNV